MASARQRDGRWTGLYRDQGRQRSALPQCQARPDHRGRVRSRVAQRLPAEPTSRATYEAQLKHIIRDLGSVPLADLDAPKCRSLIRRVEATGLSSYVVDAATTDAGEDPTTGILGSCAPIGSW